VIEPLPPYNGLPHHRVPPVWRPALDRHAGQPGPDRHGPDAALVACAAL